MFKKKTYLNCGLPFGCINVIKMIKNKIFYAAVYMYKHLWFMVWPCGGRSQ